MAGEAIVIIRDWEWLVTLTNFVWELKTSRSVSAPASGTGMLLDVGYEQIIEVTTLPIPYPLDVAFISETMVITEVYRNVEPYSEIGSTLPARYFFEVGSGDLEGIDSGDRARLELLP